MQKLRQFPVPDSRKAVQQFLGLANFEKLAYKIISLHDETRDMVIYVIFWSFVENIMANIGLIDFKLGYYIKVNVNKRENKFEVLI